MPTNHNLPARPATLERSRQVAARWSVVLVCLSSDCKAYRTRRPSCRQDVSIASRPRRMIAAGPRCPAQSSRRLRAL